MVFYTLLNSPREGSKRKSTSPRIAGIGRWRLERRARSRRHGATRPNIRFEWTESEGFDPSLRLDNAAPRARLELRGLVPYSGPTVRKRSKPASGTEETRAEGPSEGPAPDEPRVDDAQGRRRRSRGRRRGPKAHDSLQGSLFDSPSEPRASEESGDTPRIRGGAAEGAAPEDRGARRGDDGRGDQEAGGAKKSRSKRRRERRKAAIKGQDGEAVPDSAAGAAGATAAGATAAGPSAAARQPGPKGQGRPERGRKAEGRPPRADGGQGKPRRDAGKDRRRSQDARRQPDRGPRQRGRIDGLPAFSPEDLAAVSKSGRGGEGTQRYPQGARSGDRTARAPVQYGSRRLEALAPSSESLAAIDALEGVLDEVMPLQARHRAELRGDIRRLWEELTSDRESRSDEYLGTPAALSAYLRYFMPWNVFRLTSLLTNADFCLPDGAVVVDIGSGPLTLPIALWASRPELRDVPLTIYCMDRVERIMEAGLAIFETLCMRSGGRLPPWRIVTRKDSFGAPVPEKAHLVTAANVFNEFFWKDKRSLGERSLDTARTLLSYIRENGSVFVMEPGDPRSGSLISALRAALLAEGAAPLGPCPHSLTCPMPGIFRHLLPPEETRTVKGDPNAAPSRYVLAPVVMPKKRDKYPWCHLGIDAIEAPSWLEALSEEAGLPKERAVLSYLWAARGALARPPVGVPEPDRASERERRARAGRGILVRVVSEPFALPDGSSGQYACSSLGYTLLKRSRGEESFASGDLLEVAASPLARNDEKSGAIILPT
jgi:hypothetical protein